MLLPGPDVLPAPSPLTFYEPVRNRGNIILNQPLLSAGQLGEPVQWGSRSDGMIMRTTIKVLQNSFPSVRQAFESGLRSSPK